MVIGTSFNSTTCTYVFFGNGNYAKPGLEFLFYPPGGFKKQPIGQKKKKSMTWCTEFLGA